MTWIALPPRLFSSSAISFRLLSSRAASTSFAPWSAAIFAVARPMPLEAPVITMVCSRIGLSRRVFIPESSWLMRMESAADASRRAWASLKSGV